MIELSADPAVAERQMAAIIFTLTTFGYIDGDFDVTEREVVRETIRRIVTARVETALGRDDTSQRQALVDRYSAHFNDVFDVVDQQVSALLDESVAWDEGQEQFLQAQLKRRCFEILESFDRRGQEALMETIDELLIADGVAHPAELRFRSELAEILEADMGVELLEEDAPTVPPLEIRPFGRPPHEGRTHPFLDRLERHYPADPIEILSQMENDRDLTQRVMDILAAQRAAGRDQLVGVAQVVELAGQKPFLDGHVYVVPEQSGRRVDLTVLGDLHGCYSCLKAALMQSRFFDKVEAFRADPSLYPEPKLIFLGDYIDRGIFSYNGVLRAALQTFVAAPEHVYLLRGNHEFYVEYEGTVYGGVRPAEAIESLRPYAPEEIFRHFKSFFEALPNVLLLDGFFFVHGGLPRDLTIKDKVRDLAGLNDKEVRFQMMWSDPSPVDVIPARLQTQSARFPFGQLQFEAFMQRIGCHTLIRGHEKVEEGFRVNYRRGGYTLATLFSAGGRNNRDLPERSSYRRVSPAALTIQGGDGRYDATPWVIDYEAYVDPARNAFHASPPQIEHKTGAHAFKKG